MAFSSRFAFWEQKESRISNPFCFSYVLGMVCAGRRLACERGSFGNERWTGACVHIWGLGRMTRGPVNSLLSEWAPALSHTPLLSSTSSKLSCLLSHWCPSKLTLPPPFQPPKPCCSDSPLGMWTAVEEPLGMALAWRPRNWVSPHLGAVEGKEKEPGSPSPEGDSGCRAGRASVQCTVPSWAMTYDRQSPLGGGGGSESASG